MSDLTKEGVKVEVGQVWRDLDKRMRGRTIKITKVYDGFAYYEAPVKRRIAIKRMHRHSTGFELVSQP